MSLLGAVIKVATKGVTNTLANPVVSNTIKPVARRVVPEIANNMPGFYGGGSVQAAGAALPKMIKGVAKGINRELNPTQLKQNKLFHESGITDETQTVVNRETAFLESPEVKAVLEKRARKEKLTDKEKDLVKKINNTGKIIEGQLEWNHLVTKQYGMDTKLFDETIALDNYYGTPLPASFDNIRKGLSLHKPWVAKKHMSPGLEEEVIKHVKEVQGVASKADNDVLLFVKKPNASNAAGNLIANTNKKSTLRNVAKEVLRDRGKPFNTIEDFYAALSEKFKVKRAEQNRIKAKIKAGKKLTKAEEKVDLKQKYSARLSKKNDAILFQDSFTTSSYSLGGVNNHTFAKKDGIFGSTISDLNDIGPLDMPGGKTGLSITPTYFENVLALKGPALAKYKLKNKIKLTKRDLATLKAEKKREDKWREQNQSNLPSDFTLSKAMQTAGLNKKQVALVKKVVEAGASPLQVRDFINYLVKMGATGTVATGLLSDWD